MNISQATVDDAAAILQLQKIAYRSEAELHDDFDIPPLTQSLAQLEAEFEHKIILKIEQQGVIVASGQVSFKDGCAFIARMAVIPALQGRGLGSRLMAALESSFPKAEYYRLFTGAKSTRNLAMYQRRGYQEYARKLLGKTEVVYLQKDASDAMYNS
ncbi:GNAT family N-acetyltransferase [Halioxenophilus aromaticivorans]